MKYTARELCEYFLSEEGDIWGLANALMNNDIDFSMLITETQIKRTDGLPFITFPFSEQPIYIKDIKDNVKNLIGTNILVLITHQNDDWFINLPVDKDGDLIIEEDVAEKILFESACLSFIEYSGADTRGKVKSLIEKGIEIRSNMDEVEAKLREYGIDLSSK